MNEDLHTDIDIENWEAMRRGEKTAFEKIYHRYFKLLYNYGKKIGIDTQALEDAIHDLFVDIWRSRENLSPTSSVRFYLYRSLRRRVKRNMTANYFLTHSEFTFDDILKNATPSSEQKMIEGEIHDERIHRLKNLLNDLSPRQYEALILRFYDELSFEEIGSILHVNAQSARNLVHRGLVQLKQFSRHGIILFFCLFWI